MNTKAIGIRSEARVMRALLELKGYVLLPYGENQRYDMVFEEDDRFYRVQCKTGQLVNGVIRFNTVSTHGHRGKPSLRYHGQIEFFGVHCSQNQKTYLIPIEHVATTNNKLYLRVEPTRNNQAKKILWAAPYEIG